VPLVANANIQQLNEYFDAVLPITSKTPIQAQISIAIRALAKHTHLPFRSLIGLRLSFWEVKEPFREARPIAPAGR
jgi:hypothetical protein